VVFLRDPEPTPEQLLDQFKEQCVIHVGVQRWLQIMTWQKVFPQLKMPHLIKVPALIHTPVDSRKAQNNSAHKTQNQRFLSNNINENGPDFLRHPNRNKHYKMEWQSETTAL
jgi:hypothetical protein